VQSLRGINFIDANDVNQVRCDLTQDGRINNTDVSGVVTTRGKDGRFIPDPVAPGNFGLMLSPATNQEQLVTQTASPSVPEVPTPADPAPVVPVEVQPSEPSTTTPDVQAAPPLLPELPTVPAGPELTPPFAPEPDPIPAPVIAPAPAPAPTPVKKPAPKPAPVQHKPAKPRPKPAPAKPKAPTLIQKIKRTIRWG
jgi:hypothetical protein